MVRDNDTPLANGFHSGIYSKRRTEKRRRELGLGRSSLLYFPLAPLASDDTKDSAGGKTANESISVSFTPESPCNLPT